MTGDLLRNPRILACALVGAAAIGGLAWYAATPDSPSQTTPRETPAGVPKANPQSAFVSVEMNDTKAAKLFEIADSAGIKAAFDQLETEFPKEKIERARVWFALKCISRDPNSLSAVLSQLKHPNERREFLFSSSSRLVRRNLVKPEAFEQLALSPEERLGVQASMVSALAEDARFAEAMQVFRGMPASDQRSGTLLNMVESHARADAAGSVTLARHFEGEDRLRVRGMLKSVFVEKGYADGLRALLDDTQEEREKQSLVTSVVKAYGSYRDNVSAAQFVDSLDASLKKVGREALEKTFPK